MAEIDFGGVKENVVTREEFPLKKAKEVLKDEIIAVIGYGIQGGAQAQNMRNTLGDSGARIIIAELKGTQNYEKALKEGWVPGETLFPLEEAVEQGTIVQLLLQDAVQKATWPQVKKHLHERDALYFSHGFSIVYKDQTGVVPADNLDVILVAPKGSGTSVRRNFLSGAGINSSMAVHQDYTGRAWDRTKAVGIAIGSGYLFPTTFEKEVWSDLTGERGVLMGCLAGILEAQYNELRRRGHDPSEAFNETVEELTQSLIKLIDENGMDWMYANCSETARRGALDWKPRFRDAVAPLFTELYDRVQSGVETRRVLESSADPGYKDRLQAELDEIGNSEMWRAGKAVRSLRPGKQKE
jgi:ketol-acid reductoisomerase